MQGYGVFSFARYFGEDETDFPIDYGPPAHLDKIEGDLLLPGQVVQQPPAVDDSDTPVATKFGGVGLSSIAEEGDGEEEDEDEEDSPKSKKSKKSKKKKRGRFKRRMPGHKDKQRKGKNLVKYKKLRKKKTKSRRKKKKKCTKNTLTTVRHHCIA